MQCGLKIKLIIFTIPNASWLGTERCWWMQATSVSSNTHVYRHATSFQAILSVMMPDDKVFLPISLASAIHPPERFEFVVGKDQEVDRSSYSATVNRRQHLVSKCLHPALPTNISLNALETNRLERIMATGCNDGQSLPVRKNSL